FTDADLDNETAPAEPPDWGSDCVDFYTVSPEDFEYFVASPEDYEDYVAASPEPSPDPPKHHEHKHEARKEHTKESRLEDRERAKAHHSSDSGGPHSIVEVVVEKGAVNSYSEVDPKAGRLDLGPDSAGAVIGRAEANVKIPYLNDNFRSATHT